MEYYGVKKKYLTAVKRELMMDESAEADSSFQYLNGYGWIWKKQIS